MKRFATLSIVAVALMTGGCSGDSSHDWTDFSDYEVPADGEAPDIDQLDPVLGNATEIVGTDDYRLLVGDSPQGYAPPSFRCVQLVLGTGGIGCLEIDRQDESSGGWSADARHDGRRIVWRGRTVPDEPDSVVDHFVVWSSAAPDGQRIEPIVVSDTSHLIWVMEPGEAPWGIQSIDADGFLLGTDSLVGLTDS